MVVDELCVSYNSFFVLQFLLLIFSCLRKAAWDYGRLALLMENDRYSKALSPQLLHSHCILSLI